MPVKCVCLECGKEFKLKPSSVSRGRGKFCSKLCQYQNMSKNSIGEKNPNYNNKWSDERRKSFSESRMGERNPYFKGKISESYKKEIEMKVVEELNRRNIVAENLHNIKVNYKPSGKSRYISKLVNTGREISKETREKISDFQKGKILSIETRKKISDANKGPLSNSWKGGISFEPYCQKFNGGFKERVRSFWNYTCGECGKTQEESGRKLSVHHIHYDKKVCCNDKPAMFIPLCCKCHMKTNHNRDMYENKYENLINEKYNGKSYYTKEEYVNYLSSKLTPC